MTKTTKTTRRIVIAAKVADPHTGNFATVYLLPRVCGYKLPETGHEMVIANQAYEVWCTYTVEVDKPAPKLTTLRRTRHVKVYGDSHPEFSDTMDFSVINHRDFTIRTYCVLIGWPMAEYLA